LWIAVYKTVLNLNSYLEEHTTCRSLHYDTKCSSCTTRSAVHGKKTTCDTTPVWLQGNRATASATPAALSTVVHLYIVGLNLLFPLMFWSALKIVKKNIAFCDTCSPSLSYPSSCLYRFLLTHLTLAGK
jgi:hypothetical protein